MCHFMHWGTRASLMIFFSGPIGEVSKIYIIFAVQSTLCWAVMGLNGVQSQTFS